MARAILLTPQIAALLRSVARRGDTYDTVLKREFNLGDTVTWPMPDASSSRRE